MNEFFGYPRPDGSAGVRNNVGVISAMDNVNPIAIRIADNVTGTALIADLFGRKQKLGTLSTPVDSCGWEVNDPRAGGMHGARGRPGTPDPHR